MTATGGMLTSGASTRTSTVSVPLQSPRSSRTRKVKLWIPTSVGVAVAPDRSDPSIERDGWLVQFHSHPTMVPSGSEDPVPSRWTVSPRVIAGSAEAIATGGTLVGSSTVTSTVSSKLQDPLSSKTLSENV